ncbi:MAG: TPM domain-containing protein [Treponema sp.]|nr:TPM domain-containing protein [Treponema sp.]
MTYRTLIKKLSLSDSDFEKIKDAVAKEEQKSTGEIAIAVTAESGHYSFWELLASNGFAAIVAVAMIPFTGKIQDMFRYYCWNECPAWVIPAFYMTVCFTLILAGFYLCNIPLVDRIIIPKLERKRVVTNRAVRYFAESGVYATQEHSGILIFVSYMEREVRIIADKGISEKIGQDLWNLIADELCENLKNGNTTQAIITAVEKCGELLEQNFPAKEQNPNELQDGLVILAD